MRKISLEIDYVVPQDLYLEVVRSFAPYLSASIEGEEAVVCANFMAYGASKGSNLSDSNVLHWVLRGVIEGDNIWFNEAEVEVPDAFSDDEVATMLPAKTGINEFPALRKRRKHWRDKDTETTAFQSTNSPEGSALQVNRGGPGAMGFGTDVRRPYEG